MNWNWRCNKINSSAPLKFLRETGVSRPGILVVRDDTEGSKLANECQKIINNIGLKIKVVEKASRNLKQELVKPNPFEKSKCQDSCEICSHHPSKVLWKRVKDEGDFKILYFECMCYEKVALLLFFCAKQQLKFGS